MNTLTHWSQVHTINPYKGFPISDYPRDLSGWHSDDPVFREMIEQVQPGLIVEIGVWKGASTLHMAQALRVLGLNSCRILAVDTWLGSVEFWTRRDDPERYQALNCVNGYPTVYRQFLANVLHDSRQEMVIPFPNTSTTAARWFKAAGFQADLIYVDGSHEYSDVLDDLEFWWENLRAGGTMFGDDWQTWQTVRAAVGTFATRRDLEIRTVRNKWILSKP